MFLFTGFSYSKLSLVCNPWKKLKGAKIHMFALGVHISDKTLRCLKQVDHTNNLAQSINRHKLIC